MNKPIGNCSGTRHAASKTPDSCNVSVYPRYLSYKRCGTIKQLWNLTFITVCFSIPISPSSCFPCFFTQLPTTQLLQIFRSVPVGAIETEQGLGGVPVGSRAGHRWRPSRDLTQIWRSKQLLCIYGIYMIYIYTVYIYKHMYLWEWFQRLELRKLLCFSVCRRPC